MELVGREQEAAAVTAVVDALAGGVHPTSLLLLGAAGVGKTSLLGAGAAQARAAGVTVLAAQGCTGESEQSFALLGQLLRPLRGLLPTMSERQQAAVTLACGYDVDPASAPVEVAVLRAAVLALLTATTGPVLLVVDDVALADPDSVEVLRFVLRRLADEPIAALLTARGLAAPFEFDAVARTLLLDPLTDTAAALLLDTLPNPPSGRARLEVLRAAAGNPLALVELAAGLRRGALTLLASGLGAGSRVQEMFADRLRDLPATTRRLLLYAAAAEHEPVATVMVAAGVGDDLGAWGPAERAGLVIVAGERVAFRHPLIRAAVYDGSTGADRVRAHRDVAALLVADPARRAWHLAAAATGPDEDVARALEEAATLARLRGATRVAARVLERAAQCTPDPTDRARRYAAACDASAMEGDPEWTLELSDRVAQLTDDPDVLGVASLWAGHSLSLAGRQRQAFAVLRFALEQRRPTTSGTAAALHLMPAGVAVQSGLPEHRTLALGLLDAADQESSTDPGGIVSYPWSMMVEGLRGLLDPERHAGRLLDDPASTINQALPGPRDAVRLTLRASMAALADESEQAVDAWARSMRLARATGQLGSLVRVLPAYIEALLVTGRFVDAAALLDETADLAAVHRLRHIAVDVEALRAERAAALGAGSSTRLAPTLFTAVHLDENRLTHARLLIAAGALATDAGDHEAAYRHLSGLYGPDGAPLHFVQSARAVGAFAVAAARAARQFPEARSDAVRVVAAIRRHHPHPTTRVRLQLHHADAVLAAADPAATPDAVEPSFRLAVDDPLGEQWPLERARTRLHYGQWLRRLRRHADARPLLDAAHDTALRLSAAGLAETARAELRASGAALRVAPPTNPLAVLTSQQREVVLLAARGLRNQEIGVRLSLSARTVGSHLHHAYSRLGIRGRHQIHDAIAES